MRRLALGLGCLLLLAACASQAPAAVTGTPGTRPTLPPNDTAESTAATTLARTPLPPTAASATSAAIETPLAEMAIIPAGPFTMGGEQAVALAECEKYFTGCDPENWFLNEAPAHDVSLDAFFIDLYEVTNRQYQACVAAGACTPPGREGSATRPAYYGSPEYAGYPVIWVRWEQAEAFCAWRGARLPTEAEWEKAARGTDARLYPWGESFEAGAVSSAAANFCDANCPEPWAHPDFDDGYADTSPVGAYSAGASPYGVYDMGGNVAEWVADWYAEDYYAVSPAENPTGPESGSRRALRGGSFHTPAQGLRTTARPLSDPSGDYIGFRCAAPAE